MNWFQSLELSKARHDELIQNAKQHALAKLSKQKAK